MYSKMDMINTQKVVQNDLNAAERSVQGSLPAGNQVYAKAVSDVSFKFGVTEIHADSRTCRLSDFRTLVNTVPRVVH